MRKRILKSKTAYLNFILAAILFSILIIIFLGLNNYSMAEKAGLSFIYIAIIFFNILFRKYYANSSFINEQLIIWGSLSIFLDLQIYYKMYILNAELHKLAIVGFICINFCFLLWISKLRICLGSITSFIKNNWSWILPATIFLLLNRNIYDNWIKSDGYIYYFNSLESLGTWDFSLSGLTAFQLAGHISYAYGMIWSIGGIIFGKIGIRIINMCMAVITIYCFNKLLPRIIPKIRKGEIALLTMIFTFAPLFFGISYEVSSDYATFCFFIWMVYAHYTEKKVLRIYCSILLCFSKETGVIILFGYLFGEFIAYIYKYKRPIIKSLFEYLKSWKWVNGYGGILFLVYFIYGNAGWAEASLNQTQLTGRQGDTFRFDIEYIIYKLKELFVMNFSWLIFVILIIGIIFIFINKQKIKLNPHVLPLIGAYVAFILFNLLYFTYGNYRYIQLQWFYLSIMIGYILVLYVPKIGSSILLTALAIVYFLESYIMIDPLTYAAFDKINVGNIDVVTTKKYASVNGIYLTKEESPYTETQVFFDSLLYNRQQIALEELTESVFTYMEYNPSMLVILPPVFNDETLYTFRGMYGRPEIDSYYWNADSNNITDIESDMPISFVDLHEIVNSDIYTSETFYYLQYPYTAGYDEKMYLDKFNIKECIPFEHQGWCVNLLTLQKK